MRLVAMQLQQIQKFQQKGNQNIYIFESVLPLQQFLMKCSGLEDSAAAYNLSLQCEPRDVK